MARSCCPKHRPSASSSTAAQTAAQVYISPRQVPQPQEISRGARALPDSRACHKAFTYHELQQACGDFTPDLIVGEGGFGNVYKGQLADGTPVAIKRLDRCGLQGDLEFNVEVSTMLQLQHPNVVLLLGSCCDHDQRMAVFEYMPHGNLRDLLDGRTPIAQHFNWPARLNVLLGVAKGLAYLHEVADPAVIHRDLKTANILIDGKGQPRICDFGLARCKSPPQRGQPQPLPPGATITGTPGYMPPEYAASGEVSEKSDVYAFGVVVLEVMTGMQAVDGCRPAGCQALPLLLQPALEAVHLMSGNLDPALRRHTPLPAPHLAALCEVAKACLQDLPANRPHASRLVTYLQSLLKFADSAALLQPQPTSNNPQTQQQQQQMELPEAQQQSRQQPDAELQQTHHRHQHWHQHRHHQPTQSMPELHTLTGQQTRLDEAMPLTMHLRGSAGYGNELGVPGPSRNLSPLAMGLHSSSLSSLPTVPEPANAASIMPNLAPTCRAVATASTRSVALVPLGQEGPTALHASPPMHGPMQHSLSHREHAQPGQRDRHRHSQSLGHMHTAGLGHALSHSQSLAPGLGHAHPHSQSLAPGLGYAHTHSQSLGPGPGRAHSHSQSLGPGYGYAHSHSQSLGPGCGYAHTHSQGLAPGPPQRHGRALSQPTLSAAVLQDEEEQAHGIKLEFAQAEAGQAESLTALAASLADLPLAGSFGRGDHAPGNGVLDPVQQQMPEEWFQDAGTGGHLTAAIRPFSRPRDLRDSAWGLPASHPTPLSSLGLPSAPPLAPPHSTAANAHVATHSIVGPTQASDYSYNNGQGGDDYPMTHGAARQLPSSVSDTVQFDTACQETAPVKCHRPSQSASVAAVAPRQRTGHMRSDSAPQQNQSLSQIVHARQQSVVVTVQVHSPQQQQDQSAALPTSMLMHTHGYQHHHHQQQLQHHLQKPYHQQPLVQVPHQEQQQQVLDQFAHQQQQLSELLPTAMAQSPGRGHVQQLQRPFLQQGRHQGHAQVPPQQQELQQGHAQLAPQQQGLQQGHILVPPQQQTQHQLPTEHDPLKAARGSRALHSKAGPPTSPHAAASACSSAADTSLAELTDCEMSPLRNGLIRAWPSPCKVQPPEVTANSWHHFLSACDAPLPVVPPSPPPHYIPQAGQLPPPCKSARVGVCLVCLDAKRDWQMVPCGHAAACRACAEQLQRRRAPCPVCRSPVTDLRYQQFQQTYVGSLYPAVQAPPDHRLPVRHRQTQSCV